MAASPSLEPLSIWRASKPLIVIPMSELVTPASATRAIKRRIAFEHGVTVEEIDGPSRVRRIMIPRFLVYEALRNLGFSYPQIGARVGGRDHSSVMSGLKTLAKYRAANRPSSL